MNVALFGIRVVTGIDKLKTSSQRHPEFKMGSKSNDNYPSKKRKL
jgi:hypothetical protein